MAVEGFLVGFFEVDDGGRTGDLDGIEIGLKLGIVDGDLVGL